MKNVKPFSHELVDSLRQNHKSPKFHGSLNEMLVYVSAMKRKVKNKLEQTSKGQPTLLDQGN